MSLAEQDIVNSDQRADRAAPTTVVGHFLSALQEGDPATIITFVADDIVYSNASLPTVRGKDRFSTGVRAYYRNGRGFEVEVRRIAACDDTSVLTERTDAITAGPFRMQFWVCGVFEVHDGKVTLWRDYFDWGNTIFAALRGVVGIFVPSLRSSFSEAP